MESKTVSRGAGKRRVGVKRGGNSASETPVALTVKVDGELYVRLCTFRARQRRKTQDILEQALREYLTRVGA